MTLYPVGKLRQVSPCEQSETQWYKQYRYDPSENHHESIEECYVAPLLHHREEERNDYRRYHIGYQRIDGERGDAAAEFLGNDCCRCRRGTDEADEASLKHEFKLRTNVAKRQYQHHEESGNRRTDKLQPEVPCTRAQVLHINLAERNVEQEEYQARHELHAPWSNRITYRLKQRNFREKKINYCSESEGAKQRPFLNK